jgi:hypothetical protein
LRLAMLARIAAISSAGRLISNTFRDSGVATRNQAC